MRLTLAAEVMRDENVGATGRAQDSQAMLIEWASIIIQTQGRIP